MDFSYLMELLRYPFSLATTQYNYRGKMSQGLTTSSLTACGRAGTPTCWHFSSPRHLWQGRYSYLLELLFPYHLWQGRYSFLLALLIPSQPVVGQVPLLSGISHPLATCGKAGTPTCWLIPYHLWQGRYSYLLALLIPHHLWQNRYSYLLALLSPHHLWQGRYSYLLALLSPHHLWQGRYSYLLALLIPHHLWQGKYSYLLSLFIPLPPVVGQVLLLAGSSLTICGRAGTPTYWHFSSPHHLWQGRYSQLLALFIPSPPVVGQVLLVAGTFHPLTTCGRAGTPTCWHFSSPHHLWQGRYSYQLALLIPSPPVVGLRFQDISMLRSGIIPTGLIPYFSPIIAL